jgi:drug/metabolite transporter (DMT)-like permease
MLSLRMPTSAPTAGPHHPRAPAALLLATAAILFAAMALLTKSASARLPGPQVACVRFLIGLGACAIAAQRYPLRPRSWAGLFWRGAFGGTAVLCYFLAIEHLPVGIATLLNYTAPVFTVAFAALFLREPVGLGAVGALALTAAGVAGVVLGRNPSGLGGLGPWELVGLLSAVLSGAAVATIRQVRKTDGPWEIFTAFCLVGAAVTGVPAALSWVTPTAAEWGLLGLVGGVSVAGQLLMTYALKYVRAAVAGILMQLTPIAALVFGFLLHGDRIPPLALAGAAVTLVGVSWGAWLASGAPAEDP